MLAAHLRMAPVEVGLLGREQMQVPLAGLTSVGDGPCPGLACEARHPTCRDLLTGLPSRVEPETGTLRASLPARPAPPWTSGPGGSVVRDDVDDGSDTHAESLGDEGFGLAQVPKVRINGAIVGYVITTIGKRGGIPGGHPDRVDPQPMQIVQAGTDACDVPNSIAVAVGEASNVDLIDDTRPPPLLG